MTDEEWMQLALTEATLAAEHGDIPVGAVLVSATGDELARGHNRREVGADPTAHAEILALREAALKQGHWRLEGATLYVTLEPCPMCAGALVNARVKRVVSGAHDPKAGAVESLYRITQDSRLNHRVDVVSGVLADLARAKLQEFFRALRARGEK
jgi:tRNA(adenine34) deaminase